MRLGQQREECVRLGYVDIERVAHVGELVQIFIDDPDPAKAAAQCGEQVGGPALAPLSGEQADEPPEHHQKRRPANDAHKLKHSGGAGAGEHLDTTEHQPEHVEERRVVRLGGHAVGHQQPGAMIAHPGPVLCHIGHIEEDALEDAAGGRAGVAVDVWQGGYRQQRQDEAGQQQAGAKGRAGRALDGGVDERVGDAGHRYLGWAIYDLIVRSVMHRV